MTITHRTVETVYEVIHSDTYERVEIRALRDQSDNKFYYWIDGERNGFLSLDEALAAARRILTT
jgi:hypothetical protein